MSAVERTRKSIQAYKAKVQSGAADPVEYQAIEENLQRLEQELNLLKIGKRKEIDVTDSNSILAFVGNVISKDGAKQLSDQIWKEYLNGFAEGLQLRPPTWSEELEYYVGSDTVQPETRSAAVRNLAAISTFGGGNEAQWRSFEHPWIMAIKAKTVKEEDLKAILFSRLKDSAATYHLSITNVQNMSFGEVMQKLQEHYTIDRLTAYNQLCGTTQQPKETIEDFSTRMQVVELGIMPVPPHELACLTCRDRKVFTIPNPLYEEEKREYELRSKISQASLTTHFLQGLRPKLLQLLRTNKFDNILNIFSAAEEAQWMRDTLKTTDSAYAIQHNEQSDALHWKQKNSNKKDNRQGNKSYDPDECYNCHGKGHSARDCKKPKKDY